MAVLLHRKQLHDMTVKYNLHPKRKWFLWEPSQKFVLSTDFCSVLEHFWLSGTLWRIYKVDQVDNHMTIFIFGHDAIINKMAAPIIRHSAHESQLYPSSDVKIAFENDVSLDRTLIFLHYAVKLYPKALDLTWYLHPRWRMVISNFSLPHKREIVFDYKYARISLMIFEYLL